MAILTCWICSLDDSELSVEASYTPRELKMSKGVPWNEQKTKESNAPNLAFTDAGAKTLSFELLFDTYEAGLDVHKEKILKLEKMIEIIEPSSTDPEKRRPHRCMFEWGSFKPFEGVIEQLSVTYTMFFDDGTPCRATASITMKENAAPESSSSTSTDDDDHRAAMDEDGG